MQTGNYRPDLGSTLRVADNSQGDTHLPRLFREHEAARFLRVSIDTVRRERRLGRIGYTPVRGRVFYTEEQLRAYLNSQEVKLTCENQSNPETVSLKSESTGSPNGQTAKAAGKEPGTTRKRDKHAAFLLAQRTLRKPS